MSHPVGSHGGQRAAIAAFVLAGSLVVGGNAAGPVEKAVQKAEKAENAAEKAKKAAREARNAVEEAKQRLAEAKKTLQQRREAKEAAAKKADAAKKALKQAKQALAKAEKPEAKKKAKKKVGKQKKALQAAAKTAKEKKAAVREAKQAVKDANAAVAKAQKKRKQAAKRAKKKARKAKKARKNAHAEKAYAARKALRKAEKERKKARKEVNKKRNALEQAKRKERKAGEAATKAEKAVNKAETRAKKAEQALGKAEEKAENASERVEAAKKALQQRKDEKAAAEQAVKKAKATIAALKKAKKNQSENVKEELKKVREAIRAARAKVEEKKAAVQEAEKVLNEAQADAKKAQHALAEAKKASKKAKRRLAEARKTRQKRQEKKKQAAERVDAAKAALEKAKKKLGKKAEAIVDARDKLAQRRATALGGLEPISSEDWTYEKAKHLLFRAGFGGPPEKVKKLVEMGPHKAVSYFVDYHERPEADTELDVTRLLGRRKFHYQNRLHKKARRNIWQRRRGRARREIGEVRKWWLKRMAESPRPLQEKLTLFWHDHFAVEYRKVRPNWSYLMYKQNQMLRRHAGDSFSALLHGIIKDPAMIRYLDNHRNRRGSGNENLGRELQELFSMGERNSAAHNPDGYTEKDVREVSRALTGYTWDPWTGQFRFRGRWYDAKKKTIHGRTNRWSGDGAVEVILDHPATARYISRKLFRFFVHRDAASAEPIEKMAHVLRSNDYRLRPLLTNLFLSKVFYSERARGKHIKSPAMLAVSTVRVFGLQDKVNYGRLDRQVRRMGQKLFDPPDVSGWDEGKAWISANRLLKRYNRTAQMLRRADATLLGALKSSGRDKPKQIVDYLSRRCLVAELPKKKRKALVEFLGDIPPADKWSKQPGKLEKKLRTLLVMLVSTPEYQMG